MAVTKKRKKVLTPAPRKLPAKNVDIKQVSNGWIVSQWNEQGKQITKIAKTKPEAKKFAIQMLGL